MTEPELSPAETERVRRLLAEARHTDPIPADVAGRLDLALADLAAEREQVSTGRTVVSLAARRRRRRGTTLLVAAAAVTVVGVGIRPLLGEIGMSDQLSADSSAGSKEMRNGAPEGADSDGVGGAHDAPTANAPQEATKGVPVSPKRFHRDAQLYSALTRSAASTDSTDLAGLRLLSDCPGADTWGTGVLVPATYAGRPGALVYRDPERGTQRVELFLCGRPGPIRRTLIALP